MPEMWIIFTVKDVAYKKSFTGTENVVSVWEEEEPWGDAETESASTHSGHEVSTGK